MPRSTGGRRLRRSPAAPRRPAAPRGTPRAGPADWARSSARSRGRRPPGSSGTPGRSPRRKRSARFEQIAEPGAVMGRERRGDTRLPAEPGVRVELEEPQLVVVLAKALHDQVDAGEEEAAAGRVRQVLRAEGDAREDVEDQAVETRP